MLRLTPSQRVLSTGKHHALLSFSSSFSIINKHVNLISTNTINNPYFQHCLSRQYTTQRNVPSQATPQLQGTIRSRIENIVQQTTKEEVTTQKDEAKKLRREEREKKRIELERKEDEILRQHELQQQQQILEEADIEGEDDDIDNIDNIENETTPTSIPKRSKVFDHLMKFRIGSVLLPEDLEDKITTVLRGIRRKVLRADATLLSQTLRERTLARIPKSQEDPVQINNENIPVITYGKSESMAYVAHRMTGVFSCNYRVLSEIYQRFPDFTPTSLMDFGSGPGTAVYAAKMFWPTISRIQCVEPSTFMQEAATTILSHVEPKPTYERFLVGKNKYDLVISSYVMSELLNDKERVSTMRTLWRCVNEGGMLVLVEPGTPVGFKIVKELRSLLLDPETSMISPDLEGTKAQIVAPCPHALNCPMANNSWCHFVQRVVRHPIQMAAKENTSINFEDEKFSYMIFRKTSQNPKKNKPLEDVAKPGWSRLVRQPIKAGGHVILDACKPEGELQRVVVARSHGRKMYKEVRKSSWGDGFIIDEDTALQQPNIYNKAMKKLPEDEEYEVEEEELKPKKSKVPTVRTPTSTQQIKLPSKQQQQQQQQKQQEQQDESEEELNDDELSALGLSRDDLVEESEEGDELQTLGAEKISKNQFTQLQKDVGKASQKSQQKLQTQPKQPTPQKQTTPQNKPTPQKQPTSQKMQPLKPLGKGAINTNWLEMQYNEVKSQLQKNKEQAQLELSNKSPQQKSTSTSTKTSTQQNTTETLQIQTQTSTPSRPIMAPKIVKPKMEGPEFAVKPPYVKPKEPLDYTKIPIKGFTPVQKLDSQTQTQLNSVYVSNKAEGAPIPKKGFGFKIMRVDDEQEVPSDTPSSQSKIILEGDGTGDDHLEEATVKKLPPHLRAVLQNASEEDRKFLIKAIKTDTLSYQETAETKDEEFIDEDEPNFDDINENTTASPQRGRIIPPRRPIKIDKRAEKEEKAKARKKEKEEELSRESEFQKIMNLPGPVEWRNQGSPELPVVPEDMINHDWLKGVDKFRRMEWKFRNRQAQLDYHAQIEAQTPTKPSGFKKPGSISKKGAWSGFGVSEK